MREKLWNGQLNNSHFGDYFLHISPILGKPAGFMLKP